MENLPRSKCDNPDCGCHSLDVGLSNHIPLPEAAREGAEAVLGAFSAKMTEALAGFYRGLPATLDGSGAAENVVKYFFSALRAEGATAERARIRQLALDEAGRDCEGPCCHRRMRDFAALLEEP